MLVVNRTQQNGTYRLKLQQNVSEQVTKESIWNQGRTERQEAQKVNIYIYIYIYIYIHTHTGCPRRNVPDFGRMFLMLKYTDITQNTYVQKWPEKFETLTAFTHL